MARTPGTGTCTKWRRGLLATLAVALLAAAACSDDPTATTAEAIPVTTTAASTTTAATTTTTTSIPTGRLAGQIYLVDRETGVRTSVILVVGDEDDTVGSTLTASDGSYSFEVTEPGLYGVRVEVSELLDECDRLRTERTPETEDSWSLWYPGLTQVFDQSGIVGQYVVSVGRDFDNSGGNPEWAPIQGTNLEPEAEWTLDLMFGCD